MHGNDKRNTKLHHLYGINDREENEIHKYGISGKEFNKDGTSPRANEQVNLFNRVVGWARFYAQILLINIAGREKAEDKENEYIQKFEEENGRRPRGNPE